MKTDIQITVEDFIKAFVHNVDRSIYMKINNTLPQNNIIFLYQASKNKMIVLEYKWEVMNNSQSFTK